MKSTTLRFGNRLHAAITAAAEREGVTFAQYVREAAVMRVAWEGSTASTAPSRAAVEQAVLEVRRQLGT